MGIAVRDVARDCTGSKISTIGLDLNPGTAGEPTCSISPASHGLSRAARRIRCSATSRPSRIVSDEFNELISHSLPSHVPPSPRRYSVYFLGEFMVRNLRDSSTAERPLS